MQMFKIYVDKEYFCETNIRGVKDLIISKVITKRNLSKRAKEMYEKLKRN